MQTMVPTKDVHFPHQKKNSDTQDTVTPETNLLLVGSTTKNPLTVASGMAAPHLPPKKYWNGQRRGQMRTTIQLPQKEQNLRRRHCSSSMSRKRLGRVTCSLASTQPTMRVWSTMPMCRSTPSLLAGVTCRASLQRAGTNQPASPSPSPRMADKTIFSLGGIAVGRITCDRPCGANFQGISLLCALESSDDSPLLILSVSSFC